MGQLTNQFVSQSYQGLLNLANANTGFTTNLQTITDGLGGSSPLQISQTQVNISGTFTVNGAPVSVDTGSLVTTSSFNAYTSSVNIHLAGLDVETGSLQNQINQKLDTGSFNTYTASNDSKVNSLINATGSYATTSSLTALSQSIATTDLAQDNRLTSIEGITGSLATTSSLNSYTLTSSFNAYTSSNDGKVNDLISKTGSYATTGSNNFVGQQNINGNVNVTGSLFAGNTHINNTLYVDNIYNESSANLTIEPNTKLFLGNSATTSSLRGHLELDSTKVVVNTGDIVGSTNVINLDTAGVSITGSVDIKGNISAVSASFTYVNTVYETASVIYSSGSNQFGDASNDTQTLWGTVVLPTLNQYSGSTSNNFVTWNNVSQGLEYRDTISSSSFATNAATASIAFDLVVNGKCDNPGGLTRGTIVRITGANGDNPLFNSASWTDDFNSANTLGMLSEDVAYNGFANVVVQGKVIGINTSGMTAGDLLFLSSSGQYTTSSVPAPYHEVRLGQVLRPQLNNGSAYISIDNGYELTELHDVDIQSVQVGDVLTYVSGSYGQWVNKTVDELGYLQTSSFNTYSGNTLNLINQKLDTGSFNTYTASMDARTGSYATTGSNNFIGTENITGSLNLSGSATLNVVAPNDFKQNLVLISSKNSISSSAILESYLNAVTTSLDSDDFNFAFGPAGSTLGAPGIAGSTGSYFISGSNNFIMNLISQLPLSQGRRSVLGSVNIVQSAGLNMNTSSLTIPAVNNNYFGGSITATYTTGSNAGNNAHQVSSNFLLSSVNLNHQSASITTPGSVSSFTQNTVIGALSSNASGSLLTNPINISQNIAAGTTLNLNHLSSSINFTNNIHVGGGTNNINSSYFQTGSNNSVAVASNFIGGQAVTLNFGGSPSTNVSRTFVGNLIGGQNTIVSMQAANTDLGGLRNSVVWGMNLNVSGSHSAATTTQQGAAFLGRWNGEDNGLADSARTVFAVGTGTATGTRRTSLYVTSGSLVGVSGSMDIKGVTNALVVTGSQTIQHSVAGQPALTVIAQSIGQPALLVSGTFNVTGSGDHSIIGNSLSITGSHIITGSSVVSGSARGSVLPLSVTSNTASLNLDFGNFFELALTGSSDIRIEPSNIKPGQTINIKLNTTGSGTVSFPTSVKQPSGSAYVPTTAVGTDILTMVSFDTTNLFVANVKNLI